MVTQPGIPHQKSGELVADADVRDSRCGVWRRCRSALPENSATENLLVDWTQNEDGMTVWLTEQTLGGAGVVESLIALASAEPRKFFRAVDAALAPSDLERASDALGFLCRRIREDEAVADLAERCAAARDTSSGPTCSCELPSPPGARLCGWIDFGVSANARLFRPGMGRELWSLLADLDEERVACNAAQA